jgi:hypothetical protein
MSDWTDGPADEKPFRAMSDAELVIACRERMLHTSGSRGAVIARLDRHTARGGGVIKNRVTTWKSSPST